MDLLSIALCLLPAAAAAVSIGLATGKALDAIARQPEAADKIRSSMILGLALAEGCAIYGLLVAILLIFVK
jgi:F-type H+-transporting ATPase subunit c